MKLKCYWDCDGDLWIPVGDNYACQRTGVRCPLERLQQRWAPLQEIVLSDDKVRCADYLSATFRRVLEEVMEGE